MDNHRCHAPGCRTGVTPDRFACILHWWMLPRRLRDAIQAAYRPGQENDKRPSKQYLKAARAAYAWYLAQPPRIGS